MASELRDTGISVVGDMPWGTHLCHFYETKEDLLDILIPYFKAGLENEEFCIWVVSDPLGEEEARNALRQAIPEADQYLSAGHIEIVPYIRFPPAPQRTSPAEHIEIISHTDWYLKSGAFIAERVLNGWNQKLADALARGYAGLRANGNEAWLTEENREAFSAYERTLDENLAGQRLIVLCSYPLSGSSAAQIFDVVNTHQLGILRRRGKWERIETPEPIHAKAEIKRINKELRRALDKRSEPPAILRYGVAVLSVIAAVIILVAMDASLQAAAHVSLFLCAVILSTWFGGIRPGLLAIVLSIFAFAYILPPPESFSVEVPHLPRLLLFALLGFFVGSLTAAQRNKAVSLRRARDVLNGTLQQLKQTNEALRREITERKRAEEKLEETSEQLRALSASLQSAREEESKRIAREIHDELGGALTSWQWDLEEIREAISDPLDSSQVAAARTKIQGMVKLTEATLDTVRRLASELRPAALELGLVEAVEWQGLQFQDRTGIPVKLECSLEKIDLDNGQATGVFRILQEALTNIQRHAQATKVTITMKEQAGQLLLTIEDNGRGMKESEKLGRQTLGLLGMRERAHLAGGEINIESAEGKGTKITVEVPFS